jgi:hypothetical protein
MLENGGAPAPTNLPRSNRMRFALILVFFAIRSAGGENCDYYRQQAAQMRGYAAQYDQQAAGLNSNAPTIGANPQGGPGQAGSYAQAAAAARAAAAQYDAKYQACVNGSNSGSGNALSPSGRSSPNPTIDSQAVQDMLSRLTERLNRTPEEVAHQEEKVRQELQRFKDEVARASDIANQSLDRLDREEANQQSNEPNVSDEYRNENRSREALTIALALLKQAESSGLLAATVGDGDGNLVATGDLGGDPKQFPKGLGNTPLSFGGPIMIDYKGSGECIETFADGSQVQIDANGDSAETSAGDPDIEDLYRKIPVEVEFKGNGEGVETFGDKRKLEFHSDGTMEIIDPD